MRTLIDLSGRKFGQLTVVRRGKTIKRNNGGTIPYWVCICDCGKQVEIVGGDLKSGRTQSCGCYQREAARKYHTKHNMCGTRLHGIWLDMKRRCRNNKRPCYGRYGGRGITICDEWNEFIPFKNWALLNGYADNLTIDRIDNDGDYEPDNCRWVTMEIQANNNSKNRILEYEGETHTMAEWAKILNISYSTIRCRVKRNWPMERIVSTPQRRRIDGHYIT